MMVHVKSGGTCYKKKIYTHKRTSLSCIGKRTKRFGFSFNKGSSRNRPASSVFLSTEINVCLTARSVMSNDGVPLVDTGSRDCSIVLWACSSSSNYILGHLPLRGAASSPSTSNGNQPGLDELFARKNRKINRTSSTFILHKKKVEQT